MAYQSTDVGRLEDWLGSTFVDLNTTLEEAYFAADAEILDRPDLDEVKRTIADDGAGLVARIAEHGEMPAREVDRYRLLGAVGFHLAACRRHEVDVPGRELVWSLASRLGASLGVAPRCVFAHQCLYGDRLFTTLADERVFVTQNGLGVLAYQRAADALRRIPALGVSGPLVGYLLEQAEAALTDVLRANHELAATLDVRRFYLNIRPYFKSYRVGELEYRGMNAGDFSAINEIDLLLGLCSARDPFYQRVLTEKYAYVPPGDQASLRAAVDTTSLLDLFLEAVTAGPVAPRLDANARRFLAVCRAHGAAFTFHHHRLVKPFLEAPAGTAPPARAADVTASGPPLAVVVAGLERLRDLRTARDRPGAVAGARAALDRLRAALDADRQPAG